MVSRLLLLLSLGAAVGIPALGASAPGRLYVTSSLGDDITVIDLQSFKAVQDIRSESRSTECVRPPMAAAFTQLSNLSAI